MSDLPDDPDLLAAEYVLGALTPEEKRALEALALHDPAIAQSISDWQDRLAPLGLAIPAAMPPPVLWRRLALASGIDSIIASRSAPKGRSRLWRSPGFWRATTVGAMAVAASLLFMLVRPAPTSPPLVAALAPSGAPAPVFLVRVAPDGGAVVVVAATATPPAGRSFELWALAPGATVPVSLGLLPETGQRQLTVPNRAGTQLLVSQEPQGGSPTGQPTGPVVFSGTLTGA
ncbi:MAG: anti-sigma factor [Acetobacteraceae bacterium]|nr:anti-sigma factor [Acetobacteraceae bacterium]